MQEETWISLQERLKAALPEHINVSREGSNIRLVILNKDSNAYVERSVYFDGYVVRMYVHNFLIPQNNDIYREIQCPEQMTEENVCDYLKRRKDS